ncbi:hypothetical protein [Rhodoferax sp.]|uniref:hypothetical protein n=1 Tax=Rhodoferax sp. TaxID=50421 RepID=UPI0039B97106
MERLLEDGEREESSVVRCSRATAAGGTQYEGAHCNLDMELSLGFCVRSQVGVQLRHSFALCEAAKHCVAVPGKEAW